jgi:hypothetical protein
MEDIQVNFKQMLYALFKCHPELKKDFQHYTYEDTGRKYGMSNSEFRNYKKTKMVIVFPTKYRDEVLSISKFCGVIFTHEFYDDCFTTFRSDNTSFN